MYDVAFDIAAAGFRFPWPLVFTCLVSIGAGITLVRRHGTSTVGVFAVIICTTLVLGTLAMLVGEWRGYQTLREAVAEKRVTFIEGTVNEFYGGSPGGNLPETFSVSGTRFEIEGPVFGQQFKSIASQGGPDLSGRCVRIGYVDSESKPPSYAIVWLGIRRNGCEPTRSADPAR